MPTVVFQCACPYTRAVDTVTTDSEGQASVYVRLGPVATNAVITAVSMATGDSAKAIITIRPGNPTSLAIVPKDTAVYVNRGYVLKAELRDQYGNGTPTDATFSTQSAEITVTSAGALTAHAFGRDTITAQSGARSATAFVSVVPEGRIAALHRFPGGDDSSYIALVNLDGTAFRAFPMQIYESPQPAWHPSGSYVIAARVAAGGGVTGKPRISALDTANGTWRTIPGLDPSGGGDGYGEFSHDGSWIYISRENPGTANYAGVTVFRIRVDGSGAAEVVGYDAWNDYIGYNHPTVSRNDNLIAITMNGFGAYRLIVPSTPSLGESPQGGAVTDNLATGTVSGWSPVSDTTIMFGTEGMWLMPADKNTLADRVYLAPATSTTGSGGFEGASWSPDGKWILAKSETTMILVEVATRRVIPLPIGRSLSFPAWRPR